MSIADVNATILSKRDIRGQFKKIMDKVRVRYAPSPTGTPHIGNTRTALFNFLFAKNQRGKFILRIEDTDQKRLIPDSIRAIKESLNKLGLLWDEYYLQSKRLNFYRDHLATLKAKDFVYKDESAWRFKVPKGQKISWDDIVHGQVSFSSSVLDDFVIVKSDGFPTYHFASVIDDHQMKISHVIRGDEWISSTPKHLLLYEAFGWSPPSYVHIPPILGQNKQKLSKREGAKSVVEYIQEGYIPEAIINFLALLGWMPKGDRELFSLDELTGEFSLERLNKNSPIFNLEKLNWFNNQWIKRIGPEDLAEKINALFPKFDKAIIKDLAPIIRERMFTLKDFETLAGYHFKAPVMDKIPPVLVSQDTISQLFSKFRSAPGWGAATIKDITEATAKETGEDRIRTIASLRNIISGQTVTPPLYESLEILGREETIKRLNAYLKKKKKR